MNATPGIEPVRLAAEAMATRFELVVHETASANARAAGEEALREIVLLEDVLSFYRPSGALGRVNRAAGEGAVPVPVVLFELLSLCASVHTSTDGCFDPTVGPLMRAWGLAGGPSRVPDDDELAAVRDRCGMQHVRLDPARRTVRFDRPGMAIDLGGVGKGSAIDEAMLVLREAGVERALLHGGTSTVRAIGDGPDSEGWTVGIPWPSDPEHGESGDPNRMSAAVTLHDEALSVSETAGKGFEAGGRYHGHVLDPRTGRPVAGAVLAAVAAPSAALSDALSTALLVLGPTAETVPAFRDSTVRWLVAWPTADGSLEFLRNGLPPAPSLV